MVMNNLGQHKPPAEPDRELVERAIVRVLEIAQHHGITSADFIQMMDSGIRISDFLKAMNVFTNAGYNSLSTEGGFHDDYLDSGGKSH
jgi:hypothetical protein